MSPELIAILAVGVGLAGLMVTSQRNLRNDLRGEIGQVRDRLSKVEAGQAELTERVAQLEAGQAQLASGQQELADRLARLDAGQMQLRERLAKLEGLLEGLREAVTGRRVSGDAA